MNPFHVGLAAISSSPSRLDETKQIIGYSTEREKGQGRRGKGKREKGRNKGFKVKGREAEAGVRNRAIPCSRTLKLVEPTGILWNSVELVSNTTNAGERARE
jgi:hypothetical protein